MRERTTIGAMTLAATLDLAMLTLACAEARAFDETRYPDWKGQWVRIGGGMFDPTKPNGRGQVPPLTPEYQAIWEANLAAVDDGGQNYNPQARCLPGGMPRMMIAFEPMEIIVRPDTTYMHVSYLNGFRRVHTDGRDWPKHAPATLAGYSIGQWTAEERNGRYDTLLIETRGFHGPRHFEASGIPLHQDNQTIVKERIRLDKTDHDILLNEITTFDHALTRPWTVTRKYRRERNAVWVEHNCAESQQVFIGKETYFRSAEGHLMPTGKDQPPPDLRHFNHPGN
jgi:hypothetical protein